MLKINKIILIMLLIIKTFCPLKAMEYCQEDKIISFRPIEPEQISENRISMINHARNLLINKMSEVLEKYNIVHPKFQNDQEILTFLHNYTEAESKQSMDLIMIRNVKYFINFLQKQILLDSQTIYQAFVNLKMPTLIEDLAEQISCIQMAENIKITSQLTKQEVILIQQVITEQLSLLLNINFSNIINVYDYFIQEQANILEGFRTLTKKFCSIIETFNKVNQDGSLVRKNVITKEAIENYFKTNYKSQIISLLKISKIEKKYFQ